MKLRKSQLEALKANAKLIENGKKAAVRKSAGDANIEVITPKFSFSKYLRGMLWKEWPNAELEKQEFQKALGQDTESLGGFLVPTQVSNELIELLKATTVVRTMPGVRIIDMTTDKLTIGRLDNGPQVSWGAENTVIAEDTSTTFGQVSLELNKMVCLYKVSRELLQNANTSVDDLLKREMAEASALAEDLAFLQGTGGTQPLGLYNHMSIHNTDLSGTIDYDNILDADFQVENANSLVDGWISHPRTKNTLRKIKDGEGNYLYVPAGVRLTDGSNATMDTIYGSMAKWTTQISTTGRPGSNETYMVGGRWSDMLIGQKPEVRIETTDTGGDAFATDQVWIKLVRFVDMGLRHPESFVRIVGIQA